MVIKMAKWALVIDGRVVETTDIDPDGRFHPDFVWIPTGETVIEGYTYQDGRFAAPVVLPSIKTIFSPREYLQRFTLQEQMAIRQAQFLDMEVGLVYDDFNRAQYIDLNDPAVAAGIDLYIAKGLLDPERRDDLLQSERLDEALS